MRGPSRRWRERGGWLVRLALSFDDIMEIALALLALSPVELEALGWSFADRKRLLDHFLASGKSAQGTDPATLGSPASSCDCRCEMSGGYGPSSTASCRKRRATP
jgi:hypothetical protein